MTANAWQIYDTFKLVKGDGQMDMDGDEWYMALFLSASNADTNTHDVYADLNNEHANANGYTTGGTQVTNVTWTEVTGTVTWDFDDHSFTAAGGSIIFRFAVIYAFETYAAPTGSIVKQLVCRTELDDTPADITVLNGNTLTVQINANGVFQESGGGG